MAIIPSMDKSQTHQLFSALAEQLAVRGERVELVVIVAPACFPSA